MALLRKAGDIKSYLYISKEKVAMLHEQIASSQMVKKSLEWGFDLKAIKFSYKSEWEKEDRWSDKLKAVIQALEDADLVGTIDNPKEYFKATLPMKWGLLRDWGRPSDESPLIYFGGSTPETMFGLGGSSKHVIGTAGAGSTDSRSSAPSIIGQILAGMNMPSEGWRTASKYEDENGQDTYEAIEWANRNLKLFPEQTIEFYAKTLLRGDYYPSRDEKPITALLGSPVYASLAHSDIDFSYC